MASIPIVHQSPEFREAFFDRGGENAARCYQCATCSSVCELAPANAPFPRRQILWAQWGLEDIAVHVKGMEPAGYDPRALKGMGLAYATSDRGACHLRATFYKPELSGMIDPAQVDGKAELFVDFEDRLTLFDTLILCRFYRDLYPWEMLQEIFRALTGMDADPVRLRQNAAAIATLTRRFNIREGLTPEDDRLPKQLHRRLKDSDLVVTEEEIDTMVHDYYRLRGWNSKGVPENK